jgi:hypothetical protein
VGNPVDAMLLLLRARSALILCSPFLLGGHRVMMDGTIRQTYYDDKQRGQSDSPHIPVQYKRNRVARRGGQRESSFWFGSTRPIVAMEEEAASEASLMVLIPTFSSAMSGVLSKLLDEQFLLFRDLQCMQTNLQKVHIHTLNNE